MSERWDDYFMDVAVRTSEQSYANNLKVGAVAVLDKRIICVGFNGTPPNLPNECETGGKTLQSVLHAEENMVLFSAKHGIKLDGCVIYVTHSPCLHCARMIYGAGIKELIYKETYKRNDGIAFLNSVGFNIRKYNDTRNLQ